jgi:hypothetical protein
MPATARPRPTVSAPTLSPLPFGLLTVAAEETRSDPHAQFGVQFEPASGVTGGVVGLDINQVPTGALTPETFGGTNDHFPTLFTEPFLIYAAVQGRFQGYSIGEIQERANAKLALTASRWIERGLYTGASGGVRLNAGTATSLSATPVSAARGLGLIQQWISDTVGAQGVLHLPPVAAPALNDHLAASGPRMLTRLGTPVAVGAGYLNTAPGGAAAAAGVAWLYATGPVQVNRSETQLRSVPDGQKADLVHGTATAYATEVVSVGFEAGVAAVPISL